MKTNDTLGSARDSGSARLYSITDRIGNVDAFVATSRETRAICNDPRVYGLDYTRRLQALCTDVIRAFPDLMSEREAVVVNILRGGLNFGLREALGDAFGWNAHTTCFMSAQRARDDGDPENWHITENSYKKVYFPPRASFVIGDVVATGTSLRYGLHEFIISAAAQKVDLRNIFFFTFGGPRAGEILAEIDGTCREMSPPYGKTILVYLEGRFTCPTLETPLTIRLTGTDLVRWGSLMAPEFVESQYEDPAYPIERCIIYDAGSRAFWLYEYVEDVIQYWRQNLQFANHGMSFAELLAERFPGLDPARFGDVDLKALSLARIEAMEKVLSPDR
jgi:hypothetical protein